MASKKQSGDVKLYAMDFSYEDSVYGFRFDGDESVVILSDSSANEVIIPTEVLYYLVDKIKEVT